MRHEKPLQREGSFKEYAANRPSGASKPKARKTYGTSGASGGKRSFGGRDDKPDRRNSRGNSFKDDRRNSNNGPREMFDAVCSKCKKLCKVPFKPTSGKPVLCSDCFVRKDSGDRRSSFGGRNENSKSRGRDDRRDSGFKPRDSNRRFAKTNSGERELFDAVCSKCNNKCKVPFKPTTGKPVSCSNCFVKKDPGSSRGSFGNKKQFNRGRR